MERKVICPHCGLSSEFECGGHLHCWVCAKDFVVDECDFQNVKFIESNDGYHCWQSKPTAYHTVYACLNYPKQCERCIHNSGTFCMEGRIDFRLPVDAIIGKGGGFV